MEKDNFLRNVVPLVCWSLFVP